MDIYSSSKNPKHRKTNKKAKKGNFFSRIKEWFLSMSVRKRSVVIALLAFILALVLVASFILGYIVKWSLAYHHDDDFWLDNVEPISKDVTNIALFGIDTRDMTSFEGLSDSIMILSLNKKDGKIKIVSVMRDSLVKIPGYDSPKKINTAYSLGGPELAVKTLNSNFGLDINEYATVNFLGMADIIDAVGGINVNVLKSELNATNGLNHNIKHQAEVAGIEPQYVENAGYQKLNGMQAVAWARIRSVATEGGEGNDFGRTDRQRYVMEQLLNSVTGMSVSEYPSLINRLLPYVKTSLSVSEIASLSSLLTKGLSFEESRIPQDKYIINGNFSVSGIGSTVYYNLDYAKKVLHAYLYEGISPEDYMKQNGVDKTKWYNASSNNITNTSSKEPTVQNETSSSEPPVSSEEDPIESEVEGASSDVITSEDISSVSESSEPTINELSSNESVEEPTESEEPAESEEVSSEDVVSEETPIESEDETTSDETELEQPTEEDGETETEE